MDTIVRYDARKVLEDGHERMLRMHMVAAGHTQSTIQGLPQKCLSSSIPSWTE